MELLLRRPDLDGGDGRATLSSASVIAAVWRLLAVDARDDIEAKAVATLLSEAARRC
jgi:hypothetical protein